VSTWCRVPGELRREVSAFLNHGESRECAALRLTELNGEDSAFDAFFNQSATPSRSACVNGMFLLFRYCLKSFITIRRPGSFCPRSVGQINRCEQEKTSFEAAVLEVIRLGRLDLFVGVMPRHIDCAA